MVLAFIFPFHDLLMRKYNGFYNPNYYNFMMNTLVFGISVNHVKRELTIFIVQTLYSVYNTLQSLTLIMRF